MQQPASPAHSPYFLILFYIIFAGRFFVHLFAVFLRFFVATRENDRKRSQIEANMDGIGDGAPMLRECSIQVNLRSFGGRDDDEN